MRVAPGAPQLDWRLSARLCVIQLLINLKPSEPFLTEYLLRTKHFTDSELAIRVWPWSTFGAFVLLLPLGLLAESIGCRAVIFIGLLAREGTRVMLIYGTSVPVMAAMQCTYAASVAADAIFFAYVFQVADPPQYTLLTSIVLATYHMSTFLGAVVAQSLVWTVPGLADDVTPLFYLSWAFVTLGLAAFPLLPPPCREPPPSLASLFVANRPRVAFAELSALYRPGESRRWLFWFLLAGAGNVSHGSAIDHVSRSRRVTRLVALRLRSCSGPSIATRLCFTGGRRQLLPAAARADEHGRRALRRARGGAQARARPRRARGRPRRAHRPRSANGVRVRQFARARCRAPHVCARCAPRAGRAAVCLQHACRRHLCSPAGRRQRRAGTRRRGCIRRKHVADVNPGRSPALPSLATRESPAANAVYGDRNSP